MISKSIFHPIICSWIETYIIAFMSPCKLTLNAGGHALRQCPLNPKVNTKNHEYKPKNGLKMEGTRYFRAEYDYDLLHEIQKVVCGTVPAELPRTICGLEGCNFAIWCGACVRCEQHCGCTCIIQGCRNSKGCPHCGWCFKHCRCSPIPRRTGEGIKLPHCYPYSAMVRGYTLITMRAAPGGSISEKKGLLLHSFEGEEVTLRLMSHLPVKHFLFGRVYAQSCFVDEADDRIIKDAWSLITSGRVDTVDPYNECGQRTERDRKGLVIDGPTIVPVDSRIADYIQKRLPGWSCASTFTSPSAERKRGGAEYAVIVPPERNGEMLPGWTAVDSFGRAMIEKTAGRNRGLGCGTSGWVVHSLACGREVVLSEEDINSDATHIIIDDLLTGYTSEGVGRPFIVGFDRGVILAISPTDGGSGVTHISGCTIVRITGLRLGDAELRFFQPCQMLHLADRRLRQFAMSNVGRVVEEEDVWAQTKVSGRQMRECLIVGASGMTPTSATGCYIASRLHPRDATVCVNMLSWDIKELLGTSLLVRDGMLLYADGTGATVEVVGDRGHISRGVMRFTEVERLNAGILFNQSGIQGERNRLPPTGDRSGLQDSLGEGISFSEPTTTAHSFQYRVG